MAIQAAICVNCGGELKVDDTDLNGFCECSFCHTPHKVIDIITIDGLPTAKTFLMNAQMALEDNNPDNAVSFFNEVLRIKPNCHEAWWGLYLCNMIYNEYYGYADKYGNSGPYTKASIISDTIEKYARRAIQFAPPTQAKKYEAAIADEIRFVNSVRSGQYDNSVQNKNGCFIATAVYGDYCCDEVFTLRRYRDDYLAHRWWGRAFIRVYYKWGYILSKHIKKDSVCGKTIRRYLDRKVEKLNDAINRDDWRC